MNNQARTCELKCKYNVQGICHAYGECIAKDLFISELEKIKARLNHRANEHLDGDYYVRIKDINEVVDEELAGLKG